jgi:hypothetical protein
MLSLVQVMMEVLARKEREEDPNLLGSCIRIVIILLSFLVWLFPE